METDEDQEKKGVRCVGVVTHQLPTSPVVNSPGLVRDSDFVHAYPA